MTHTMSAAPELSRFAHAVAPAAPAASSWSAIRKLAINGLRGSWLDWYPEVGQCLSTNLQWQSEVLDERRAVRKQSVSVFHTCRKRSDISRSCERRLSQRKSRNSECQSQSTTL